MTGAGGGIVQAILGIGLFILIFIVIWKWKDKPDSKEPFQVIDSLYLGDNYDVEKYKIQKRSTKAKTDPDKTCSELYKGASDLSSKLGVFGVFVPTGVDQQSWDEIDGICYSPCSTGWTNLGEYCFKNDFQADGELFLKKPHTFQKSQFESFFESVWADVTGGAEYGWCQTKRQGCLAVSWMWGTPSADECRSMYDCQTHNYISQERREAASCDSGYYKAANIGKRYVGGFIEETISNMTCVQQCNVTDSSGKYAKISPAARYGLSKDVIWDQFSADPYTCWNTNKLQLAYGTAQFQQEELLVDQYYDTKVKEQYNKLRAKYNGQRGLNLPEYTITRKADTNLDGIPAFFGQEAFKAAFTQYSPIFKKPQTTDPIVSALGASDQAATKAAQKEFERLVDEYNIILQARKFDREEKRRKITAAERLQRAEAETKESVLSFLQGEEGGWSDTARETLADLKKSAGDAKGLLAGVWREAIYGPMHLQKPSGNSSTSAIGLKVQADNRQSGAPIIPDATRAEVFVVGRIGTADASEVKFSQSQATTVCSAYGAAVATEAHMATASQAGANWGNLWAFLTGANNGLGYKPNGDGSVSSTATGSAAIACYGYKPQRTQQQEGKPIVFFNSTAWSMFDTGRWAQQEEVYLVDQTVGVSAAQEICMNMGARQATLADVQAAGRAGASWTEGGWAEGGQTPIYPSQQGSTAVAAVDGKAKVLCYGIKPTKSNRQSDLQGVYVSVTAPFNASDGRWSQRITNGSLFRFDLDGHIVDMNSGKCLQLKTGGTSPMSLEDCSTDTTQQWIYASDSTIRPKSDDKKAVKYNSAGGGSLELAVPPSRGSTLTEAERASMSEKEKAEQHQTNLQSQNFCWQLPPQSVSALGAVESALLARQTYLGSRNKFFLQMAAAGSIKCTPRQPRDASDNVLKTRYVRIQPSTEAAAGTNPLLAISQVLVMDELNTNIAIGRPVSVSSSYAGGSEGPTSALPSFVVNGGVLEAQSYALGQVWMSATGGATEFLEIDLGSEKEIGYIIFLGRADTGPSDAYLKRNKGVRIQLLNSKRVEVAADTLKGDAVAEQVASFCQESNIIAVRADSDVRLAMTEKAGTREGNALDQYILYVTKKAGVGLALTDEERSTLEAKVAAMSPNFGNTYFQAPDISGTLTYLTQFKVVIENAIRDDPVHMQMMAEQAPLNFFAEYDFIPKPRQAGYGSDYERIDIPVFGEIRQRTPRKGADGTVLRDSNNEIIYNYDSPGDLAVDSVELCRRIFLGNINEIGRYLRVKYEGDDYKMYMRKFFQGDCDLANRAAGDPNACKPNMRVCKPEVLQRLVSGQFQTQYDSEAATFNNTNCSLEVTPELLAMMPFPTRNFIKNWFYNRRRRIMAFKLQQQGLSPRTIEQRLAETIRVLQPKTYIDLRQTFKLDAIAQAFYEEFEGRYKMNYIYDVMTVGNEILDVRFDIVRHGQPNEILKKIREITIPYRRIAVSDAPEDVLNQARVDYITKLTELKEQQDANIIGEPIPILGRFFYAILEDGSLDITGFTLDPRAVSSYNPALNGGLNVLALDNLGAEGNVNYEPKTIYTLNPFETIDCTDDLDIRRIMLDYMEAAPVDLSGVFAGQFPRFWEIDATLRVTEVLAATQISPLQCLVKWRETLYDSKLQKPIDQRYVNIPRVAIITYKNNTEDWWANEIIFSAAGFKFLDADATGLPACVYNRADFIGANPKLAGKTNAAVDEYYKTRGIRDGLSPCPGTNPGAQFNGNQYYFSNSDAFNEISNQILIKHYRDVGMGEGRAILSAVTLAPFSPPIKIKIPRPSDGILDTLDGQCPMRACTDMDVLYSLTQQYNDSAKMPGSILRITKATTPNENQCDVEAVVDYDTKRGTSSQAAGNRGTRKTTLALYASLDPTTCSYRLEDAGGADSGTTIDADTPPLYKPFEYAVALRQESEGVLKTTLGRMETLAGQVFDVAKNTLSSYRLNTFAAVGNSFSLQGCPQVNCANQDLVEKFIRHYESKHWGSKRLEKIIRIGTVDGLRCDYTFETRNLSYNPTTGAINVLAGSTEGARATLRKPDPTFCSFEVVDSVPMTPSPPWEVVSKMDNLDQNMASLYKEGSVNIPNTRPNKFVDCAINKAANAMKLAEPGLQEIVAIRNKTLDTCLATVRVGGGPATAKEYTFRISEGNEYTVASSTPAAAGPLQIDAGVRRGIRFTGEGASALLPTSSRIATCPYSNPSTPV